MGALFAARRSASEFMYIEPLKQQMAVCSFEGAERLTSLDKKFWNVISIRSPEQEKASLPMAKSVYNSCFDDVEDEESAFYRSPRATDITSIFEVLRSLESGPLLIHCQMGVSRSAAVALAWIYGHLPATEDRASLAIDLLLNLRPQAIPNRLVLKFGLSHFVAPSEALRLAHSIVNEPRLAANRCRGF
jgi:predicted protein tyrosine phosphatase